jgi:hypothetical protein
MWIEAYFGSQSNDSDSPMSITPWDILLDVGTVLDTARDRAAV